MPFQKELRCWHGMRYKRECEEGGGGGEKRQHSLLSLTRINQSRVVSYSNLENVKSLRTHLFQLLNCRKYSFCSYSTATNKELRMGKPDSEKTVNFLESSEAPVFHSIQFVSSKGG